MSGHRKWHNIKGENMTEEEKKIKKWSNEQKVETLAKFVALRSGDPKNALLYGFMLDCLLDEIDKRERKINKQQSELEKKDKMIDEMSEQLAGLTIFDIEKDEIIILGDKNEVKQYFERKIENVLVLRKKGKEFGYENI